ncbi:MAG: hypothetical protein WBF53_15890 [Litorimonas sp.]
MKQTVLLVQFLPPWRGSRIDRFRFHTDGHLEAHKPVRTEKALHKAARNVDGLVLRPSWPTQRGLALVHQGRDTHLYELDGFQVRPDSAPMDLADPTFRMHVAERIFYRRFTFETSKRRIVFRDFAGRLVAPQRASFETFPEEDFSPFARLIGMLGNDALRARLLADFDKHRFRYSRWLTRPDRTLSRYRLQS